MDNEMNSTLTEERAASISVSPQSLIFTSDASNKTVNVICADQNWAVGGGSDWCKIAKSSTTKATVMVKANTGAIRNLGVVCTSGANVANISVKQAANISVKGAITLYKQEGGTCAATCACMCVNKSPTTVSNDGFDLGNAEWSKIASKYGYTVSAGPTDNPSFTTVYNNSLAKGLPAIVKINTGTKEHWVVLVGFTGIDPNDASSYTCADPWTGRYVQLNNATNYNCTNNKFYRYLVYKKI